MLPTKFQMAGSIYGMSSMKNAHFVPIGYQTWPPQAILVSDWSISKKSSPVDSDKNSSENAGSDMSVSFDELGGKYNLYYVDIRYHFKISTTEINSLSL
jgi:hypothetical protein